VRPSAALLPSPSSICLICLICPVAYLACLPPARAESGAASAPITCLERLDAAVALAEGGDEGLARLRLERMAARCEGLAQVHHNLGVLAARADRLPEALAHFERALAAAPRAWMTLGHVRALHRREAALGYARAFGTSAEPPEPQLRLQDSDDTDPDDVRSPRGERERELRRLTTLEYELYAWWSSADQGTGARLAHYVDGYPAELALGGRERDASLAWEAVRHEVTFTAEDAVVTLEHAGAGETVRRVLLLRLEGGRWKIYRDAPF